MSALAWSETGPHRSFTAGPMIHSDSVRLPAGCPRRGRRAIHAKRPPSMKPRPTDPTTILPLRDNAGVRAGAIRRERLSSVPPMGFRLSLATPSKRLGLPWCGCAITHSSEEEPCSPRNRRVTARWPWGRYGAASPSHTRLHPGRVVNISSAAGRTCPPCCSHDPERPNPNCTLSRCFSPARIGTRAQHLGN